MKTQHSSTRLGLVGIYVLGGCISCSSPAARTLTDEAVTSGDPSRRLAVDVFVVAPEAQASGRLVPGVISVDGVAVVLAKRDGTLTQLEVEDGSSVVAGQAIAQLDDGDSRFQRELAKLELKRAQVEAQQRAGSVSANRLEYDRHVALFKDGLVSRRDLDRARHQFEDSRREVEKTRVAVQMAHARVRAEDERTAIRSPFDGVVTRRYARLGNSVQHGDKLFEVTRSGGLQVQFELSEPTASPPEVGGRVELLDSSNGRIVGEARIHTARADGSDADAQTYLAEVVEGSGLKPGMAFSVRLQRETESTQVAIPRAAFRLDSTLVEGESGTVYVVLPDGTCRSRAVRIAGVVDERVEVSSDLAPGDRIVLAPPSELQGGESLVVLSETTGY